MIEAKDLPVPVVILLEAMNLNNAYANGASEFGTAYAGHEITAVRRKYFLLNSILTNGQRSARFLINRTTLAVYGANSYERAVCILGTCEGIAADYTESTETYKSKGIQPQFREIPPPI